MRHRLVDLLACPECGHHPLAATVFETEAGPVSEVKGIRCSSWCSFRGEAAGKSAPDCAACYGVEIAQAVLRCTRCDGEYPVIDGIPRFNPDVYSDYPEFARIHKLRPPGSDEFADVHGETKRSFGFQWLKYEVTDNAENRVTFFERTGETPSSLQGKLFFEAGCGMGRYLSVIGEQPDAEVVGLDLSLAVNRARAENRSNPFVHVVQGNIMQLPLRPAAFDHVYSIGVLHHTPDTRAAFLNIVKLAKPGAKVSVWVYHVWRGPGLRGLRALQARLTGWITDGLRVVTTRLPHSVLHVLCHAAVPLGWLQARIRRGPLAVRAALAPLLFVNCSPHPKARVRILDTFDWYSPRYQWKHTVAEAEGWFREAGLVDIDSRGAEVSVRGRVP